MLLQMYLQFLVSSAILAVANLGVADAINDEPRDVDAIAKVVGADPSCLLRLLRALAAIGIFREQGERRFVQTPRSTWLRSDHPAKESAIIRMFGIKSIREAMVEYENAIRTGRSAFEIVHGATTPFGVIASRPAEAEIYHEGMSVDGELISRIIERCDFSDVEKLVDIGGGKGTLLARILLNYPEKRGILFDFPEVVASTVLAEYGVSDRCEVQGGDLRDEVPAGADCYILKNIMHGRSDDECIALLRSIRANASAKARVVIIENVMTENPHLDFAKVFDLFLLLGGNQTRVRSVSELRDLLNRSGFTFASMQPISQSQCVVVGEVG